MKGGGMAPVDRLSLPRVADPVLRRTRLEGRLSEWSPLTVIRGLRGSGKTTLAAMWLEQQRQDDVMAVWVAASPPSRGSDHFETSLSRSCGEQAWCR